MAPAGEDHMRTIAQVFVAVVLASAVLAVPGGARAQSPAALVRTIRQADTPDAAATAYRTALREDRHSSAPRQAYVERMIELNAPRRALSAARLLVALDSDNSVGWTGIILARMAREEHVEAIKTLATHSELLKGSDRLAGPAGELSGWYEHYRRSSAHAGEIRREVDTIRSTFASREAYRKTYRAATAEHRRQRAEPRRPVASLSIRAPVAVEAESPERNTGDAAPADSLPDFDSLTAEDFTISHGLNIGVSHASSDLRAGARVALDPEIAWFFRRGSVVSFRAAAVPDGRYVTLSGSGGTFRHGTVQYILVPDRIYVSGWRFFGPEIPPIPGRGRDLGPSPENGNSDEAGGDNGDHADDDGEASPPPASSRSRRAATRANRSPKPPWQREPNRTKRARILRKRLRENAPRPRRPSRSRPVRRRRSHRTNHGGRTGNLSGGLELRRVPLPTGRR
jgi:hypothetical protein